MSTTALVIGLMVCFTRVLLPQLRKTNTSDVPALIPVGVTVTPLPAIALPSAPTDMGE